MSEKSNRYLKEFTKGIFRENPIFVLLLGLCPTLAVTSMVSNGIGMGVAFTFVLLFSNILISSVKNFIPDKVRIPAYIVIIASFVTIVDLMMKAFMPPLSESLGVFVPLIVVNCIILGRAEAFASKNSVISSILDALGIGLGFTIALVTISLFREIIGTWGIDFSNYGLFKFHFPLWNNETSSVVLPFFGKNVELYKGALVFVLPSGGFFSLGLIIGFINMFKARQEKVKKMQLALKEEAFINEKLSND